MSILLKARSDDLMADMEPPGKSVLPNPDSNRVSPEISAPDASSYRQMLPRV